MARLEARYEVARVDPGDPPYERVTRQVALEPAVGAPLTIRWTNFPGVNVTYGRWHEEGYPQCGCDACDENPDDLIEDLEARIEAAVSGRFSESVSFGADGWWLGFSFEFEDGRMSGRTLLPNGHPATLDSGDLAWPAWPCR